MDTSCDAGTAQCGGCEGPDAMLVILFAYYIYISLGIKICLIAYLNDNKSFLWILKIVCVGLSTISKINFKHWIWKVI